MARDGSRWLPANAAPKRWEWDRLESQMLQKLYPVVLEQPLRGVQ